MSELVLIVTIAGRAAALRAAQVHSVVELEAVVPVPRAPGHVLGLSALRSNTLTVVDAAAALGLEAAERPGIGTRTPIVDHHGHRYALVVEGIDDVATTMSEPVPVPGEAGDGWQRASDGLIETDRGPALLLSLDAMFGGATARAA
ncbi:chemotaxis protein CheW [Tsuneonella amylolytica]|uniref:chemotaxis protein CheW n=1 Tax=Tsuneonella amylolytica TaxID=2338327 RepID=UPI000EA8D652|nr:chemotaxis protein CheW [Tsuneonella amylolytica]